MSAGLGLELPSLSLASPRGVLSRELAAFFVTGNRLRERGLEFTHEHSRVLEAVALTNDLLVPSASVATFSAEDARVALFRPPALESQATAFFGFWDADQRHCGIEASRAVFRELIDVARAAGIRRLVGPI